MESLRIAIAVGVLLMLDAPSSAADYERGSVPAGGLVFYASFEDGPKADAGIGFPEMHYVNNRQWGDKDWVFSFVDGRFGKSLVK